MNRRDFFKLSVGSTIGAVLTSLGWLKRDESIVGRIGTPNRDVFALGTKIHLGNGQRLRFIHEVPDFYTTSSCDDDSDIVYVWYSP